MYTTPEQVAQLTGYLDVAPEAVQRAQGIIETFTGKTEGEVEDAVDLALLGRATAYQVAYMEHHGNLAFEQMSLAQVGQFGSVYTFKQGDQASPWVAPLAVMACKNLSWLRPRTVKTGKMGGATERRTWWND